MILFTLGLNFDSVGVLSLSPHYQNAVYCVASADSDATLSQNSSCHLPGIPSPGSSGMGACGRGNRYPRE